MENRCTVCLAVAILVAVGALNWGLVGLGGFAGSDWNLVHGLVGDWPLAEWIVYILIGAAGVAQFFAGRCPCAKKM